MTAGVVFTLIDSSAKYLSDFFPVLFIVWARFAGQFVSHSAVAFRGEGVWRTRRPLLQAARSALLLLATLGNFIAIAYLPLSVTIPILFTYPLLVAAQAPFLLKEHLPVSRWLFLLLSFTGVLIIMRPGTPFFHWAMLASLASAYAVSLYGISTRAVAKYDSPTTSSLYASLGGAVVPVPFLVTLDVDWPSTPLPWIILFLIGMVLASAGHQLFAAAHRHAPASVLAPYVYTQIVMVIIAGYLFFGNFPDVWTLVGCSVIIASSLIYMRIEWRAVRAVAPDQGV